GIEALKTAWRTQEKAKPQVYDMKVRYLDRLGYILIDKEEYEKALEVFKFMLSLEPEDAGWHDSVGDAYRALGKFKEAEKWYLLAVEKGFEDSAEKIEAMRKGE
ncbi:MAG: hypothetical protein AAF840_07410, partial [Bacteroidota bacterium]